MKTVVVRLSSDAAPAGGSGKNAANRPGADVPGALASSRALRRALTRGLSGGGSACRAINEPRWVAAIPDWRHRDYDPAPQPWCLT